MAPLSPLDVREVVEAGGVEVGRDHRRQESGLGERMALAGALVALERGRAQDGDLVALDGAVGRTPVELDPAPFHRAPSGKKRVAITWHRLIRRGSSAR